MASLGALVIELAANTARLQGDLGKAVSMAQGAARRFNTIFRGVAALAGASSLGAVVAKAIETGDELNKAAIKAGITGKAMSELAYVAKQSDVELTALSTAIKNMQIALSEAATGAKEPNEALAALGLTIENLKGLQADKQFEVLADRISQLKDPADRARAAVDLFKRAGESLLPAFEDGAKGIRALREEARRLGVSFSDQQIKKLAEADTAIKRLRASWEGFATALTSKVAPAISGVLDLLRGKAPGVADDPIQRRMDQLKREIADFESFDPKNVREGLRERATARVAANLAAAREELNKLSLIGAAGRATGARALLGNRGAIGYEAAVEQEETLTEIIVTHAKIRRDAMDEYYDGLNERTMTETERQIAFLDEMEAQLQQLLEEGRITADQYAQRWQEALDSVLQKVEPVGQRIGQIAKKPIVDITEFAKEAARNMQTAFAQFLFDPFKGGLKGMLKSFIETIRRMVAEVAAAKIFGSFGGTDGVGGFIGNLLGFANGGRPPVGRPSIVGERGPELFVPGSAGTIIPNHKLGGGTNITINVDARGAQKGVAEQIVEALRAYTPIFLRQSVSQSRIAVMDDLSRGVRA